MANDGDLIRFLGSHCETPDFGIGTNAINPRGLVSQPTSGGHLSQPADRGHHGLRFTLNKNKAWPCLNDEKWVSREQPFKCC
jgi:hypothetical protein